MGPWLHPVRVVFVFNVISLDWLQEELSSQPWISCKDLYVWTSVGEDIQKNLQFLIWTSRWSTASLQLLSYIGSQICRKITISILDTGAMLEVAVKYSSDSVKCCDKGQSPGQGDSIHCRDGRAESLETDGQINEIILFSRRTWRQSFCLTTRNSFLNL